jgi:protein SCO1/2/putative membrane protein
MRFLFLIFGLWLVTGPVVRAAEELPVLAETPSFSFTDQNGKTVSSDDLKGHVWVADFIFTRCAGPCPLMTQRMVALAKKVEDPGVRFLSFSVDPEHDTPAVLKKYAHDRGATDPRMHFLSGPKEQVYAVARKMLVAAQPGTAEHPIIHSDRFLIFDKQRRMRATHRPLEAGAMEEIARTIGVLSRGGGGGESTAQALSPRNGSRREALLRQFPAINASLNATAGVFLLFGYMFIRWKLVRAHAACMIVAVGASVAFLACYVTYHTMKGGGVTRFPEHPVRPYYVGILISHTILAVAVLPMIILSLVRVWRRQWDRHRRIARPTFWIWLYVSVTGVVVYWMLYHLAPTLTAPPVPPGSVPREVKVA